MKRRSLATVVVVTGIAMLLWPVSLRAQKEPLTGDAFGAREKLANRGIEFQAQYYADFSKNLMGGVNTTGSNFGHLFDFTVTLDTQKAGLWPGGTVLANFFCVGGDFATVDVGDIQGVDNIDSDSRTALYELWYQHALLDGALRIKAGKIDANIEFDAIGSAADFLNSSWGSSPTILGFPCYPEPATGATIFLEPTDWLYIGAGVFDGAAQEGYTTGTRGPSTFFGSPADLFLITEGGIRWTFAPDTRAGRAAVGFWRHTGTFDRFDGGTEHGTCGFYLFLEQSIWSDGDRQLGVFAQYGWADEHISPIGHHLGMGISFAGPFAVRADDVVGAMVSIALLSDESGAGFDDRSETAIEIFYKAQVFPWLSVQPDIQYVMNPGGVSENDDALAFILRIVIDI